MFSALRSPNTVRRRTDVTFTAAMLRLSNGVARPLEPHDIVLVPAQDDEGQPTEIEIVDREGCDFGIAALGNTREMRAELRKAL
jgi:hypothetical protein